MPQTFFRLGSRAEFTRDDFLSYVALGIPLMDDSPETRRLAEGISVNATLAQARNRARAVPSLRNLRFVAELLIPDDAPIKIERTGRARGHYTLWGDPDVLLGYVVAVYPVEPAEDVDLK
jgi:hypothetical protein